MCLKINSAPRSQNRALLTTTALICIVAAATNVSAQQADETNDAQLIQVAATSKEAKSKSELSDDAADTTTEPLAAVVSTNDMNVYPAAFFGQYAPQNAFEMIQRLPGFSFDQGSDVRGFGGAAGNVLIDGSRPTSKSGGLRSALQRIPAAQVERIEILRGGVSGGEAAGQSTVANVIKKLSGSSGTWAFKLRRTPDGRVRPNIETAIASKLGAWDTSFDIDIGAGTGYRPADIQAFDADGILESSSTERRKPEREWLFVSGEGSRPLGGGKLTLNGRAGGFNWSARTTREGFTGRLPDNGMHDDFWRLDERREKREAEVGVDWAKTYSNAWKWRLIGLASGNTNKYTNNSKSEDFITDTSSDSRFLQDNTKTEFILRTTYGQTAGKFKPEFGVEVAKNKLDSALEFFEDGVEVELDSANVVVQEYRGEAFATFVYSISDKLTLDGGLTFEASQIKVSGDASQKQTLKFLKPRLAATYSFSNDLQLTLEAEKEVGQLNFDLFAASSNAQDDRTTAGNPDLQPDKKTRTAATLDWKFSERGSIKAKAFYQWRTDILEEIILPSGSSGRGNAGDASFYGFEIEGNFPLDRVLKGALLEVEYNHRRSSFDDPILGGEARRISWYTPSWLSFEFRHDITSAKFSWGMNYWGSFTDTGYLVDQIQELRGNKRLGLFAETTKFFGVKIRLEASDVNTGRFNRTRFFFDETRGGDLTGSEISKRKFSPNLRLEISGTF